MALADGLLCEYKLGAADGANQLDALTLGPALLPNSTTKLLSAGKLGAALATGGASGDSGASGAASYVFAGPPTSGNYFDLSSGPRTLAIWVQSGNWTNQPGILANFAGTGGGVVQWLVWYNGTAARLSFRCRSSLSADTDLHAAEVTPVATGTWYHIVVTRAADGTMTIRVNGGTKYTAAGPATLLTGTNSFQLASRNTGGAPLNGFTDTFQMWDRVLSDDEQTALYNGGAGRETPFVGPTAAFTADVTEGRGELEVQFTDQSTGSPTSWLWDFGDGSSTSTLQHPSHTYESPGVYTVSLIASNAVDEDAEIKVGYITVGVAGNPYILNPRRRRL